MKGRNFWTKNSHTLITDRPLLIKKAWFYGGTAVIAHWKSISEGIIPFGFTIGEE